MVTPHGIKFAVHLINSHFGNLVSKVCETLLRRGPLSLQLLIRFTELTPLQVKNSLLVLTQQNCVQAFSIEQIGANGNEVKITQYLALFDNILHRLRFPKFLAIVSQELGEQCEELLKGLLENGRLTLEQIYDRARATSSIGEDAATAAFVNDVGESFQKLLAARFIERCPASEPFLEPPSTPTGSSNKRGAKSVKLDRAPETTEQRVLAAAAPVEAMRFSVLTTSGTNIDAERDGASSSNASVGEKRKHNGMESNQEMEVILWRANFEEFIRCLRHKACIDNVKARLDDGAAIVLRAMLDATRSAEKKVRTENSVPLSLNTIFEGVMKSEAGRSLTLDRVRASLVQLGCPSSIGEIDETYGIDLKKIIELAQNEEVESLVLKRYGRDAYRMFRLLSKAGQLLETDKIADITFVEKKETPAILFKLWKDAYLDMEKVQVQVPGSKTFLLWKVNKPILWEHVLDEMYHAALNLSLRWIHEREQIKLSALPPEKDVKRLSNVRIYLESSLLKLDDALMLFHDF